jgi:hypothetical protein
VKCETKPILGGARLGASCQTNPMSRSEPYQTKPIARSGVRLRRVDEAGGATSRAVAWAQCDKQDAHDKSRSPALPPSIPMRERRFFLRRETFVVGVKQTQFAPGGSGGRVQTKPIWGRPAGTRESIMQNKANPAGWPIVSNEPNPRRPGGRDTPSFHHSSVPIRWALRQTNPIPGRARGRINADEERSYDE